MKLTTLGQIPDKIAQILKLEAIIAILTLLSMGLTTETAGIRWMLNQTLGYMLIAIIGTAILYVIVIDLYLMLYFHKLNPVLKYQEKIEGKRRAMLYETIFDTVILLIISIKASCRSPVFR